MALMFARRFEKYLNSWKNNPRRKPLVIRGARQVGKTSVVKKFAKENYTNFIYINLDEKSQLKTFEPVETLEQFATTLSLIYGADIKQPNTMIFIDEIQNLPNLIHLLRFFYEEMPQLPVVCAGSLLETRIQKEGFAMPVGRVEYGYMYPLTFFEFLDALGKQELKDYLENVNLQNPHPIQENIHKTALNLFKTYTMLGGMPEVVYTYVQTQNLEECKKILRNISTAYSEDIYKYATSQNAKYLSHILDVGPIYAGSIFKYEGFGNSNFKSREMAYAFDTLEKAMILNQIKSTNSTTLPLVAKEKRAKKLIWLDAGFVNITANSYAEYANIKDLSSLYQGKIAEQIVGQNILASGNMYEQASLYYWSKDKTQGSAEVDFCFQVKNKAVGLEVKSGTTNKSKSLKSFGDSFKGAVLVMVSEENLGLHKGVLNLPFYLINRVFDLN